SYVNVIVNDEYRRLEGSISRKGPKNNIAVNVARFEHTGGSNPFRPVEEETAAARKSGRALGKKTAGNAAGLTVENVIRIVIANVEAPIVEHGRFAPTAGATRVVSPDQRAVRGIQFVNIRTRIGNVNPVVGDRRRRFVTVRNRSRPQHNSRVRAYGIDGAARTRAAGVDHPLKYCRR